MKDVKEVWMPIDGLDGLYEVSSLGRVKSLPKIRSVWKGAQYLSKEKYLNAHPSRYGYPTVNLYKDKHFFKRMAVHRLVANAFIPNPENKPHINHINAVRTDNRIENLEWCTASENIHHTIKLGRHKPVKQNDAVRSKTVLQLNTKKETINEFPSTMEVQRALGFKAPNINHAIKYKKLSHGYYWRYKNI